MSSGVNVASECLNEFQELKLRKKYKYIIYKLNDDNTQIVVGKTSSGTSYDKFLEDLPAGECRYAVYDFEYKKGDEGTRNKIIFFAWAPDDAKIRNKMLYASSKDALRALVEVAADIQGTDLSEVTEEAVLDKVSRGA